MAETAAKEQDRKDFVRGLFQGSPDLSILTHAIVRKKYLAHVGQETLTKDEKEKLKRLVEEELVQMQVQTQVDDPPSSRKVLTDLEISVRSGGQKRQLCTSDTSGDEVKRRQQKKKQRTKKELEVSSDEQDSGIDSKKTPVYSCPIPVGKLSCTLDKGDSGAEDHSDGSGSNRQSTKKKRREAGGRRATQELQSGRQRGMSESESEDSKGSGLEEEDQRTESDVEQEQKDCKLQKKKAFSKQQKWAGRLGRGKNSKMNEARRSKESDTEEENEGLPMGKTHAKKRVDWSDNEEEKEGSPKAEIRSRDRTRKVQKESESLEESEDDSEEEDRRRKKVTRSKQGRKSIKVGESESDSDNSGDSRRRKKAPQTKPRGAGEGKQGYRLESNSEDGEEPERQIGKGGMTKTKRNNVRKKELEGEQRNREKHCSAKQEGRHKPKRSMSSSDESERDTDGNHHKSEGSRTSSSEGDESQSEAEKGRKGESKFHQPPLSSSKWESGSENSEAEDGGKKRMIKKRSKDVSGSEDEKSKGKGKAKPQKESVSEMESEEESKDSGSELEEKRKPEVQRKKGMSKPIRRKSSKGASENESDEEKGGSSLEENPRYSKQRHQGKDRKHSGKSEDHPSIQRLKRYIRECGVHKNYKKLLAGCRSLRAQMEVLKKELESIGLKGAPSLAKCKALKKKREEAAEVASLDLSNIITTEGRPRRRNVWSLYSKPKEPPSSPEEPPIHRPARDWSHLRGVISSDGESS